MALALISSLTMLLIIGFFSTKKCLHTFELLFGFFVLEFSYTSFLSIININLELWHISDFMAFRITEIIFVPLTILWLIDLWHGIKRNLYVSILLFIVFLMLLYLGNYILEFYKVYEYGRWNKGILGLVWTLLFIITLITQRLFRIILRKEGFTS